MPDVSVSVEGLDEFRRNLRRIDRGLGKALGAKYKEIGSFVVRMSERRRSRLAGRFPSYRSDVVKVKASANQRRAQVTIRPPAAEWGAITHPVFGRDMLQSRFQRRVWAGRNQDGWLVRPTIADHDEQIALKFRQAVDALNRQVLGA